MIRATATKKEVFKWDWHHSDGWGIFVMIFSMVGGIGGVLGAIAGFAEGYPIIGSLCVLALAVWVGLNAYLYVTSENPYVYCCNSYYSDKNQCYAITNHWHQLNEDNKAIALPLVKWVYENRHRLDTYGEPMFKKECDRRVKAVEKLLEEQKAIEYHKPDVDDSDVEAVLEYADAMRHARETLYPPEPKALPPSPTDVTGLVRAYHEKKKVWAKKTAVPQ